MRIARSVVAGALALVVVSACHRRRFGPNDAYRDPGTAVETWNQLFEGGVERSTEHAPRS
jgi:hypothetical protein